MNKYGQPPALQTISLRMKNESFATLPPISILRELLPQTLHPYPPRSLLPPHYPVPRRHASLLIRRSSCRQTRDLCQPNFRKELDVTSALFSRCGMRIDGAGDIHERVGIFFSVSFFFLFLEHK